MLCLSNVRSPGGSKLPSDIGLLSADMTAFPPLAPVKSGLSSHQGAQPVEPTFQHCCCCRSRAMARLSTVCTMAMVCYVLTLAVALSLRTVASLTAAAGDPTRSFLGSVAGLELVGDFAELCKLQLPRGGLSAFMAPTYVHQSSIPSISLPRWRKKKDNSRSTAQHRHSTGILHHRARQNTAGHSP